MTHVTEKLTDYLDSAVSPDEDREIERHLRDCAECRLALDGLRATISHLSRLPNASPPESLKSTLLERFRSQK